MRVLAARLINKKERKVMDKKEISFVSEYNENKELTLTKYLGKNDDIIVVKDRITEIGSFAFYQT